MATNPQTPENIYFDTNGVPANGVLGGLSVAEQNQSYVLLVKGVTSTTPEIINQTQYSIEWVLDSEGEETRPNEDISVNSNIIQNFPVGKPVISNLINATSVNTQLSGELNVTGVGTLKNILYSQTGIASSSYSTESVVFVEPGGAPVGSSNTVENILGGMVSSSAFTISSNTFVKGYNVTTQPNNAGGTNFNGPSGKYFISSSDTGSINSVTFRVSYAITATQSTNVTVELNQGSYTTPKGSDTFTIPKNQFISRNFSVTIPIDELLIFPNLWGGPYYKVNIIPDSTVTVLSTNFEVTSTSPQPPANIPAGDFWSTGSNYGNTWLTGSTYLSLNYGNLQDTSNFTAATGDNFGLNPIETVFELQKGDQIRFGYIPSNTFTIYDVITPSEASDGLLKVKLNAQVPNNIIPDNFIVYRIDPNDPQYIILDVNKTFVLGDPENPLKGYIIPKYKSKKLTENFKNIQRLVSQQGLI